MGGGGLGQPARFEQRGTGGRGGWSGGGLGHDWLPGSGAAMLGASRPAEVSGAGGPEAGVPEAGVPEAEVPGTGAPGAAGVRVGVLAGRGAVPGSGWASSAGTGRLPSCSQQEARRLDVRPAGPAGGSSDGDCSRQMSIAYGQRGWNTQPTGSMRRSGGEPGMPVMYRRGPCRAGNEFSSPSVYGWRGARKSSSAAARSAGG